MSESQEGPDRQLSFDCNDDTPCEQTLCETKRRKLLGALATGGTIALAGCTGILAAPQEDQIRGSDDEYELNFLREDETLTVTGSQTVLRAAERNGLELNYVCRAGYCGQCLSQADQDASEAVHMAINDVDELTDEAVEAGYFLPCTSQPRADSTIISNLAVDETVGNVLADYQEEEEDDENDEDDVRREFVTYIHEGEPANIEFEGEVDDLIDEGRNLLVAGEEEDLDLDYNCREGWCGECVAKLPGDASDLVEMTANDFLDDEDIEEGWMLTCTGYPTDSFSMRTNMSDEF